MFTRTAQPLLQAAISTSLLPAIAGNTLGEQAAPEPELQRDALGELTNVLCGTLLPTLAGHAAVFRLDPPRAVSAATALVPEAGEVLAGSARLALDEGEAVALLFAGGAP